MCHNVWLVCKYELQISLFALLSSFLSLIKTYHAYVCGAKNLGASPI